MKTALIIVVSVLFTLTVVISSLRRLMGNIRGKLAQRLKERLTGRNVILQSLQANFFGQNSMKRKQLRGNGALVLTPKELLFFMALPDREFVIPLHTITSVTFPTSHLGKSIFRPLLCVEFNNQDTPDTMAWYVPDHEAWKSALEKAAGRHF